MPISSVRAKFQLQEVHAVYWSQTAKRLKFGVQYDSNTPEDQQFTKYTPTGSFEMMCDNPTALTMFTIGDFYYLDITPVHLTTKATAEDTTTRQSVPDHT